MSHDILILGGGYAGLLSALRLARRTRGRARITLVNASDRFVERIRQHQVASGAELRLHSLPQLLDGTGVRFVAAAVEGLDLERCEARAGGQRLGYDELVLALGSSVDRSVSGVREHAFTLDAACAPLLAARLQRVARSGGRLAVCGGGLSGIELTAELCERWPGLPVTLFTDAQLGPGLSVRARAYLRQFFARQGVALREGTRVERVERDGVWCADGRHSPAELCVWAGGFSGSELPGQAGLGVNPRGQVLVDASLRAQSHRNVTVVGDAAALAGAGPPLQLSCKVALPMAVAAADNLARRLVGLPEQAFQFLDVGVCISLGRRDGLIDLRFPDGSVRERIITRRWGALLKEVVCRSTLQRMRWERSGLWPARSLRQAPRLSTSGRPQIAA